MTNEFSFPEWLRDAMKERGLTQTALADMSGVSSVCISKYLRGIRSPNIITVNIIAAALGKHIRIEDDNGGSGGPA